MESVPQRLTAVRDALTAAPADRVVEAIAAALGPAFGVTDAALLQVDYRLSTLLPLLGGAPITHPGDPAWRAFDHQTTVVAGHVGYFPVTARGERLGILRCGPCPEGERERDDLARVATWLAHELQAAGSGTDRYTVAARTRRLTLAAEMQWELLPGRSRTGPAYGLAGQLEPAYAVRGDSFDWAEQDGCLFMTVLNGMGDGMAAALLTTLATQALRNARRAGLPIADQAGLADQAVFSEHRGTTHVAALLLELDLGTGKLRAVDAGSPRMLLLRGNEIVDLPLEDQFPLGMFETSDYTAESIQLLPGDRLFVVSDGVSDAVGAAGPYGEAALGRFVRRTGSLAPLQAVRSLIGDLRAFVSADLEDDAVVVCLDWTPPD